MMKSVDYILIASGNPQSERWACRWFESRDLHGRGEIYHICDLGFIWRVGREGKRIQVCIQRDLVLCTEKERIVARMSSGALEWMRPLAEIGQATREFLVLGMGELTPLAAPLSDGSHCSLEANRFNSIAHGETSRLSVHH